MTSLRIVAACAGLALLGAGVVGYVFLRDDGAPATGLSGFHHPRTVHLAPDGRVIVTDLGTGQDDGRVVAVDLDSGKQETLLDHLPSTKNSGQRYADLAGPSGAAMARDGARNGAVCVVIGDANKPGRGFNTLRCSNGLTADFKAFEEANNPDGREIASNPYDIVSDGGTGWYVSDAAANVVLHVDERGMIEVAALFEGFCCLVDRAAEAVPTGLAISISGRGDQFVGMALFGGAVASVGRAGPVGPAVSQPGVIFGRIPHPIAVTFDGKDVYSLVYDDGAGTANSGAIYGPLGKRDIANGLNRPTGFAALPDHRFVVAEEERGRVYIVGPKE
ncbi:MAG: ScyD/ScyE family protein [Tepidiformaceae bacterium]